MNFQHVLPSKNAFPSGCAGATASGIPIRSREKALLEGPDALAKLELFANYGRYKNSIIEDARRRLEAAT